MTHKNDLGKQPDFDEIAPNAKSQKMLIDETALKHWIDNFYGYGSWKARFWFVAHEEGGGELPEDVADKINFLKKLPPDKLGILCNIRELYKQVAFRWDGPRANSFNTLFDHRFDKNAVQNTIWKNLSAFTHGYLDEEVPDALIYQQKKFASPTLLREALISLYPLPSPHNHAWYYSWLDAPNLTFIRSRANYQDHVYSQRIKTILSNIKTFQPELVLMYGMENINLLKESVQQFFPKTKFQMVKAIKLLIPQHHCATLDNKTKLIITTQIPALRHNRIETGFDWEEFGKMVNVD